MDWEQNQRNNTLYNGQNHIKYLEVTLAKQGKDCYEKTLSLWRKTLTNIAKDGKIAIVLGW